LWPPLSNQDRIDVTAPRRHFGLNGLTIQPGRMELPVIASETDKSAFAERLKGEHAARHYAAIVESSTDAILSKDLNGVITSWNRGAQLLFGYTAEEAVGQPVTLLIPVERHNEEPFILGRIRQGDIVDHYETIRKTKDGRLLDISLTVSPIKNENGEIIGASKIARDISESKRTQERLKLLLREMDHRIKNLFSLAIGVLRLSGRSATTADGVVETASARLTALARAHALTLSHTHADVVDGPKPTTLHSLIRAITAPHHEQETSSRFSVTGSDVTVSGGIISSLALLLHEFVTNATKYGALVASDGHVEIDCVDQAGTVNVIWSEHGGPPVAPPHDKKGFGDVLIRSTVESLGGKIDRDWNPGGLVIRLSVPRERLTA
jgi:PAS domain S-box-containing protein